jgi:hypothetical protein
VAVGLSLFVSGTGFQATESVTVHAWSSTNGPYGATWYLEIESDGRAQVTSSAPFGAKSEHHRFRLPRARREAILRAVEDANFFALPEFVGPSLVPIHGPEDCLEIQIRGRVLKVFLNDPASATSDEVDRFRKVWRAVSASSPVKPPL